MALRFWCECGETLEAEDGAVARRITCPACGRQMTAPASPGEVEVTAAAPHEPLPMPGGEASVDDRSLAAVPTRDWRRRSEEIEREHRKALERFTIWRAFIESLAFPIRGSAGWYTLLLPALPIVAGEFASLMWNDDPRVAFLGVVIGPITVALSATLCLGWVAEVARASTAGPAWPPDWSGRDFVTERLVPGVKAMAHFAAVVAAPAFIVDAVLRRFGGRPDGGATFLMLGPAGRTTAALILVAYYPMSLSALVTLGRLWAGISPAVVFRAILRVPVEYALTVCFAFALGGAAFLTATWLTAHVSRVAHLLWPWFVYYGLCAVVSRLGFLAYRRRYRLGWAHRIEHRPPEMAGPGPQPLGEPQSGDREDMPMETDEWLRFACACGRRLRAPFSALGGFTKCPNCGRRLQIPGTMPEASTTDQRPVFETIEHTADVGLLVRGETLEALFANAARGMFHLIAGDAAGGPADVGQPPPVAGKSQARAPAPHEVEVEGPDREALLVAWLNELLFRFETERILFGTFDVREVTDVRVTATVAGQPIDEMDAPLETELKAATYHAIRIDRTDTGWEAEVLFDA